MVIQIKYQMTLSVDTVKNQHSATSGDVRASGVTIIVAQIWAKMNL